MKIRATVNFQLEYEINDPLTENVSEIRNREVEEIEAHPLNFILPGIQPDSVKVEIE